MNGKAAKTIAAMSAIGLLVTGVAGCGGGSSNESSDGKIHIQFFQNKPESVDITNELIKDFEAENPNITVEQQNASDSLTVLKSRMAKNDIPDVVSVNSSSYNDIAQAGILADQSGTEAYKSVASTDFFPYLQKLGKVDKDYVVPWATSVQVVLYNKAQFTELGLTVPTTWDEFIDTARKAKAAGKTAFEYGWKDPWTAKVVMNAVAGPELPDDFLAQLQDGKATFEKSKEFQTAAKRMLELKPYGQEDAAGTSYDDANNAFANGESVMYIQGAWAIPAVKAANPDIEIGAFVLPTSSEANATRLLSAPDSVIGVSNSSKNQEAAQKFLDFLLSKSAQEKYATDQNLLSVRSDVPASTDFLQSLKSDYVDKGKTCAYPDSMFNGASDIAGLTQSFFDNENVEEYLTALDTDWATNGIK